MLPEPLVLRVAAGALTTSCSEVRRLCAELASAQSDVRWAAPAVDVVRRGLAEAQAGGSSGSAALEAGAAHLRSLALAVEELGEAMRRLQEKAADELRAQVAADPAGLLGHTAQQQLDRLPPPDDPSWARLAGVPAPVLPDPARVPAQAVAPSHAGLVEVELEGARRLAERCRATGSSVSAACDSIRARVGALGLSGLDAYGLSGSRSEHWLRSCAEPGSPLQLAAARWALAAREVDLLVRLLSRADRPGELLTDPRLAEALRVLEAQLRGPAAVQEALAQLSPADRAWVADIAGLVPPASAPAPSHGHWWTPSWPDRVDGLRGAWQAPGQVVHEVDRRILELWEEAGAVRAAAQGLATGLADVERRRARELVQAAGRLRLGSLTARRLDGLLRVPRWLQEWDRLPVLDVRGLRRVSRLGAVGALLGLVWDLAAGAPVVEAVVKAVVLLAVGASVAALFPLAVAALPFAVGVLTAAALELVVVALATLLAGWAFGKVWPSTTRAAAPGGRVRRQRGGRPATGGAVSGAVSAVTRLRA